MSDDEEEYEYEYDDDDMDEEGKYSPTETQSTVLDNGSLTSVESLFVLNHYRFPIYR